MNESPSGTTSPELPESDSLAVTNHDDLHMLTGMVEALHGKVDLLSGKLDRLIESHNGVGQNIAWLTSNTQGLFQMFSDPRMVNQMMGQVMGGMTHGGKPGDGTGSADRTEQG